jgi:response regulator RpfG family c-di-GMP phosphodiesterase
MNANDEILFKDELPEPTRSAEAIAVSPAQPWKILIVDDEADVHNVTTYMIKGMDYLGRSFEFLHAYNGLEARAILERHHDIAVVLLDVVMETEDSGLQLVRYIREKLCNRTVRIVLRTGQPGKAPAAKVIIEYDINDYKEKTELTLDKMLVTVISALRSYSFITTIENNRKGLKKIIDASSDIFERQSLKKLGSGVLGQLESILQLQKDDIFSYASGLTASMINGESIILAAIGEFRQYTDRLVSEVDVELVHASFNQAKYQDHRFYCQGGRLAWYFKSRTGSENFLYFEITKDLNENDQDLLELFFANVSLAFDNLFLNKGIEDTQKEIIFQIAETMECRSAETGSHVRRVAEYARLLALKYGLSEEEAEMLKLASTPHDLGKIGIPDAILNKPGPLSPEEYNIIKTHVYRGYELLIRSSSPIIRAAAQIVLQHHERWDGQGYPQGLQGEEIHIHGRIIGVADVFDALSNKRVYHEAWSWDAVFSHFVEQRGKHFDPKLVDILLVNQQEFKSIWERYNSHPVEMEKRASR